jgi:hypothetical protein
MYTYTLLGMIHPDGSGGIGIRGQAESGVG